MFFISHIDEPLSNLKEDTAHVVKEKVDAPKTEHNDNLTVTDQTEEPAKTEEEQMVQEEVGAEPDVSVEVNVGQFNINNDHQPSLTVSEEEQRLPEATLRTPSDTSLGAETEHSVSGWSS